LAISCFPACADVASEYACGDTKLRVEQIQHWEGQSAQVDFLDQSGTGVAARVTRPGKFISMCPRGAFAIIDDSVHHGQADSIVYSGDGLVLATYAFGEIARYGMSSDQSFFWVQIFFVTGNQPINNLHVIDWRGREVLNRTYDHAASQKVEVDGKTYTIPVEQPDYPG